MTNTADHIDPRTITATTPLIDGKYYDLGAIWCKWSKEHDLFLGGNFFINKGETRYKDNPVA
jgi:hypothetical protein